MSREVSQESWDEALVCVHLLELCQCVHLTGTEGNRTKNITAASPLHLLALLLPRIYREPCDPLMGPQPIGCLHH